SSVMNFCTTNDTSLPRELVSQGEGRSRFEKYRPAPSFATTIADYPYPYVIGKLCWEFPPMAPSDWEAFHLHASTNPVTVADWKAALDATVIKQGVFNLVFHPHGWIRNDQIIELIDYAVSKYGRKIKFLNFREAQERLDKNLLGGQPLRAANGQDNGVRLLDLDGDGYLDVIVANESQLQTRIWDRNQHVWRTTNFPAAITLSGAGGPRYETGVRFGIVRPHCDVAAMLRNENPH